MKKQLMTYLQLTQWLSAGFGQVKELCMDFEPTLSGKEAVPQERITTVFSYAPKIENEIVDEDFILAVRPWGKEWQKPTMDVFFESIMSAQISEAERKLPDNATFDEKMAFVNDWWKKHIHLG